MRKILLFYSIVVSIFITVGNAVLAFESQNPLFFLLFLPVLLFFILKSLNATKGIKLLLYYSFIIITIMAVMGFIGSTSAPQFFSAIIFLPMALYFWINVIPRKNRKIPLPAELPVLSPRARKKVSKNEEDGQVLKEAAPKLDLDRRKFLKLVGSAGAALFLFSIFTQKTHAAFFGSVPGPGTVAIKDTTGAQIDPSKHHPTDGYKISQLDDSTPAFYGYTNKDGNWFIMKEDSSGNYRYAKGNSDFPTNWTNRASLTYDYFDNTF